MEGLFSFMKNRYIFWLSATGSSIGIACIIKDFMQGPKFIKKTDETGKVMIVTGCNTGIGKETVRELARRGATVYMACRNLDKCEEARKEIVLDTYNKNVFCRECDLASMESIRKFVANFKEEESRLDVLINNAGVMRCPKLLTKDGFEMQIGVNHFGHFLLTNLLLDLLKKSAPSRIVNVSSLAHTRGEINVSDLNSEQNYDKGKAYSQSKLANILFTKELAMRLEGSGVTTNALHPGIVDTELVRHMGFFNSFLAKLTVRPILWPFVKSAVNGAQTTIYAAIDPDLQDVNGKYFSDCAVKDVAPAAENESVGKWLWLVSEKWTKLNSS